MKNYIITIVTLGGMTLRSAPRAIVGSEDEQSLANMIMYDLKHKGSIAFKSELKNIGASISYERVDYLYVEITD